jgi:type II secretory pathway pseudopilin PulG
VRELTSTLFLRRAGSGPHSHAGHASESRLSQEEGWLIVEMMIGAVVLVLTALAIYSGLDASSKASGRNRNRTVASYLAQQDQERMRTMDAAALASYTNTRTVTIAGVPYRVDSTSTLVNDSSGSISCTNKSATANYLKITSTVYDPSGRNKPVVQDSLLSPKPDDGNAAVKVLDRTGITGVSGLPVTLQESPGTSVNTDSSGCSLFTFLDVGTSYHVGFSRTGYVNVNGVNSVVGPISVVPGTVATTTFQYDQAGGISANFNTKVGTAAPQATSSRALSVSDSHMTISPPIRYFSSTAEIATGQVGASSAAIPATNLFPFTDQYAVYSGSCTANDPTKYGQPQTFASVTPGNTTTVSVREPAINLFINKSGTAQTGTGINVYIKQTDTGCDQTVYKLNGSGLPNSLTSGGALVDPGFPYGHYNVCADDGSKYDVDPVTNDNQNGTSTASPVSLAFNTTGTCPGHM